MKKKKRTKSPTQLLNDPDIKFITVHELAEILDMSANGIYTNWRVHGYAISGIPILKIGQMLRIPIEPVRKFVNSSQVEQEPALIKQPDPQPKIIYVEKPPTIKINIKQVAWAMKILGIEIVDD